MRNTVLSFLGGVVLILGLAGCETLSEITSGMQKPSARVTGVQLRDLNLTGTTLAFDVAVENPYDVDLPLANMTYALGSSGETFLTGDAPLSGSIPANGSRTITLPASVTFDRLLSTIQGVRPGSLVPYDAELNLGVDAPAVGRIDIPLRKSGELPVPVPPKVSISGISMQQLSLSEASAVVNLAIENPNAFSLDLNQLNYGLTLAGARVADAGISHAARLRRNGGQGEVEIPISFSPVEFGTAMLNVLRGEEASYRINGEMAAGTPFGPISLPFDATGSAPIRR